MNKTDTLEQPVTLDWPAEQLLELNLDALRARNAPLADTLAAVTIPDNIEMTRARDGSTTFRITDQDGRRHWLGYSSVPLISGRTNADRITLDATNLAFNGIGHGAEAQFILEKIAPYQALYVTEAEPLNLNLALRLRDFSRALTAGHLVLLLGSDPAQLLHDFLRDNPGYNIVSQAIAWTWLTTQQNHQYTEQLSRGTGTFITHALTASNELIAQQKSDPGRPNLPETAHLLSAPAPSALRVLNYTNVYCPTDHFTSRDAIAGLTQLGVHTDLFALNQPDIVSNHAQLTRCNRIRPHLIILVDMLRRDITMTLPEYAVCATLLRQPPAALFEPDAPSRLGPHDFVFAPCDHQLQQLHQAGFPPSRTHHLPLAVDTELFHPCQPTDSERRAYPADIALISERHNIDPEAWHITLPTHQRLWQEVVTLIQRAPAKYHPDQARQYLTRAQQCGITLREDDIQEHFTELITNYLGPTVQRDTYCTALADARLNLRIWNPITLTDSPVGRLPCFWPDSPVKDLHLGPVNHGSPSNALYNCAKIYLHISPTGTTTSNLLEAIAAGAFCLVKSNRDDRQPDAIARFFTTSRELITFDTPDDLIRKVRYYLDRPEERKKIAQAAREKLLSHHSTKHRMRQMLDLIKENLPT